MSKSNSGGVDIPTVLLIIFIVLKLCDVIDWSWLWVLSPFWITVLLALAYGAIVTLFTKW